MANPDEIINLILQNFPAGIALLESLKLAGSLSKEQIKKISQKFKKIQELRKFGCTTSDGTLGNKLIKIDKTSTYIKIKSLIGKHPTLRLIRLGLYLETLNKEGSTRIVDEIRSSIFENHGDQGLRIINIGSTGLMTEVINSLEELKNEFNLPDDEVIKRYEYILHKFNFICVYINNEDLKANITLKIEKKIEQRPEIFYIISSGNASDNTMLVIAEMNTKGSFREKGYTLFNSKITQYGSERSQYIWTVSRFI